jgi:sugar phosphate permease
MEREIVTERAALIHAARVYLAQSRHFTGRHRSWSFTLLEWAAQCRRRAAGLRQAPMQQKLF